MTVQPLSTSVKGTWTQDELQRWAFDAKLVFHDQKTILCPVPKAASASIKLAYIHGQLGTPVPTEFPDNDLVGYFKHYKETKYPWILTPTELHGLLRDGYKVIGFVRHPLSRMVSCWAHKFEQPHRHGQKMRKVFRWPKEISFPDFVRLATRESHEEANQHFQPAYMFLEGLAEEVYQIESLRDFWPDLQKRLPLADLPVANTTKGRDWREMYDEETRKLAEDYYERDFSLYGYSTG